MNKEEWRKYEKLRLDREATEENKWYAEGERKVEKEHRVQKVDWVYESKKVGETKSLKGRACPRTGMIRKVKTMILH